MKMHLVLTTINHPALLEDYARHAKLFDGDIAFTVAGDNKTPQSARALCDDLQKKYGFPVYYMGVQEQNDFLKKWPAFAAYLPWNCVQRRNVGMMYAYLSGADAIITIDDDNFIATDNYFEGHRLIGNKDARATAYNETGWYNVCDLLQDEHDRLFYPRGYPNDHRKAPARKGEVREESGRVVVNGGLWLGDPDIDAVTRLSAPINATQYLRQDHIALGKDMWCPFNSQNTALHRDCIPAYFLSPSVGRYDDIWAGYVILRLANHLGDRVAFGNPLVRQDRNAHDLWRDLDLERLGQQLTDHFCMWMRATPLTATTYQEAGRQLMAGLKMKLAENSGTLNDTHKNFVASFIDGYEKWLNLDIWTNT